MPKQVTDYRDVMRWPEGFPDLVIFPNAVELGGVTIVVKQRPRGPRPSGNFSAGTPVRRCDVDEFGLALTYRHLIERFGGGYFYVSLWGRGVPLRRAAEHCLLPGEAIGTFPVVEGEPEPPVPRPCRAAVEFVPPVSPPAPAVPVPAAPTGVAMAETMPRERMYDTALLNLLEQSQRMQAATGAMIMQMIESMTRTREAAPRLGEMAELLKALQPAPARERDPLDMALKLREVLQPRDRGEGRSAMAQVREFLEVQELLKGQGGDAGEGDGMLGVVKHFAPLLMQAINAAREQQASTPPTALPVTPTAMPQPPSFLDMLAPAVPSLVQAAQDNVSPGDVAGHLVRQIPAAMLPEVVTALRGPLAEQVCAAYPVLASWRPWVGELVEAMTGLLQPAERRPNGPTL